MGVGDVRMVISPETIGPTVEPKIVLRLEEGDPDALPLPEEEPRPAASEETIRDDADMERALSVVEGIKPARAPP